MMKLVIVTPKTFKKSLLQKITNTKLARRELQEQHMDTRKDGQTWAGRRKGRGKVKSRHKIN